MLNEYKIAYFAGFFDGEGSISVVRNRAGSKTYQLVCVVANTDSRPLTLLRDTFGGYLSKPHPRQPGQKSVYNWRASDRIAEGFLTTVLPFLILKKDRAELALAYRAAFTREHLRGRPSAIAPEYREHVHHVRQGFYDRMRELNRRGVAA